MRVETIEAPYSDEERELLSRIAELRKMHEKELEPYMKRLASLRAMQSPRYLLYLEPGEETPQFIGTRM